MIYSVGELCKSLMYLACLYISARERLATSREGRVVWKLVLTLISIFISRMRQVRCQMIIRDELRMISHSTIPEVCQSILTLLCRIYVSQRVHRVRKLAVDA